MGILNVTPDSFYDGGRYEDPGQAVAQAVRMAEQGADCIDVGGESTRPGSDPVDADEEMRRVLPVIEALRDRLSVPISIDTRKSEVARHALEAGASLVNDVSGLGYDPGMASVVSAFGVPVVLMHMRGSPKTMQTQTEYGDLIGDLVLFFKERMAFAERCGIPRAKIVLDPGIGFGKKWEDNFLILNRLDAFRDLGCPLLVGVSRKSFIGKALDLPEPERLAGTLAALAAAVMGGAHIVRVHDVREAVQAVRIADRIKRAA